MEYQWFCKNCCAIVPDSSVAPGRNVKHQRYHIGGCGCRVSQVKVDGRLVYLADKPRDENDRAFISVVGQELEKCRKELVAARAEILKLTGRLNLSLSEARAFRLRSEFYEAMWRGRDEVSDDSPGDFNGV